jgi:hypothetical protein
MERRNRPLVNFSINHYKFMKTAVKKGTNVSRMTARVKSLEKQLNDCLEQTEPKPKPEPKERPLKPITATERKRLDNLIKEELSNPTRRILPVRQSIVEFYNDKKKALELIRKVLRISRKKVALVYFYKELYRLSFIEHAKVRDIKPSKVKKDVSVFEDPYLLGIESSMYYSNLLLAALGIANYTFDKGYLTRERKLSPTI